MNTNLSRVYLAVAITIGSSVVSAGASADWGSLLNSLANTAINQSSTPTPPPAREPVDMTPKKDFGRAPTIPENLDAEAEVFVSKLAVDPRLQALFKRLYIEGERNAVLNLDRIGLAALAVNQLDVAEKALDQSIQRIDTVYSDNVDAMAARSVFSAEKIKDFKGDPYERVMTFYYRGLLYASRGDFQNARAMFKQADYQDTVAEDEKFAGDFSLMPYMSGWSSYCDGNLSMAKEFLEQARKVDPNSSYKDVLVTQKTIVLVESGRAPFKYGGGKYGEAIRFQSYADNNPTTPPICGQDKKNCPVSGYILGADVGFQATTRGGRPFDSIMNGKAEFKDGAIKVASAGDAIANIGMATAAQTGNRDSAMLGLLGFATSLVAKGVSSATETQADIREWGNLPNSIWLGAQANIVDLKEPVLTIGNNSKVKLAKLVDTKQCKLYWGREVSPFLSDVYGPLEPSSKDKEAEFRKGLVQTFGGK